MDFKTLSNLNPKVDFNHKLSSIQSLYTLTSPYVSGYTHQESNNKACIQWHTFFARRVQKSQLKQIDF